MRGVSIDSVHGLVRTHLLCRISADHPLTTAFNMESTKIHYEELVSDSPDIKTYWKQCGSGKNNSLRDYWYAETLKTFRLGKEDFQDIRRELV